MTYAKKVDTNQAAIVQALRRIGASVQPIHTLGRGVPDLLVGFRGVTYLLEVKQQKLGALTPDETEWHRSWRGQVAIVKTIDEALAVIGAV